MDHPPHQCPLVKVGPGFETVDMGSPGGFGFVHESAPRMPDGGYPAIGGDLAWTCCAECLREACVFSKWNGDVVS